MPDLQGRKVTKDDVYGHFNGAGGTDSRVGDGRLKYTSACAF